MLEENGPANKDACLMMSRAIAFLRKIYFLSMQNQVCDSITPYNECQVVASQNSKMSSPMPADVTESRWPRSCAPLLPAPCRSTWPFESLATVPTKEKTSDLFSGSEEKCA